MFTPSEKKRYQRHLTLKDVGESGQKKLKNSSVAVVGAGGLGSPVLSYLTSAGVGRVVIIDGDIIEESNLQRQILFNESDVGAFKAEQAFKKLRLMNSNIKLEYHNTFLDSSNALELTRDCKYIVDCSDNFRTRYLCNDLAHKADKVLIHGALFEFEGTVGVFHPRVDACYRCLFPNTPKSSLGNCSQNGVLGVTPGVVGSLQASEVLKSILKLGSIGESSLVKIDLLSLKTKKIKLRKNSSCLLCGLESSILNLNSYESFEVDSITPLSSTLDIREENEVKRGGTSLKNLPLSKIKNNLSLLEKSKSYTFVCATGKRSLSLCHFLKEHGFNNVHSLKNGITNL